MGEMKPLPHLFLSRPSEILKYTLYVTILLPLRLQPCEMSRLSRRVIDVLRVYATQFAPVERKETW